jgi:hypothetical protein
LVESGNGQLDQRAAVSMGKAMSKDRQMPPANDSSGPAFYPWKMGWRLEYNWQAGKVKFSSGEGKS